MKIALCSSIRKFLNGTCTKLHYIYPPMTTMLDIDLLTNERKYRFAFTLMFILYILVLLTEIKRCLNDKFSNRQKSEYRTIDRLKSKHMEGLESQPFVNNCSDSLNVPGSVFYESPRRMSNYYTT
jgi:hypothetical protein